MTEIIKKVNPSNIEYSMNEPADNFISSGGQAIETIDLNDGIVQGVTQSVNETAKDVSVLNEASSVISDINSRVKTAINNDAGEGYESVKFLTVDNGIILAQVKSGENSRLCLNNNDSSLKGKIDLDTTSAITNMKYDNENNKIIVETENGEQHIYDVGRIERSIELNQHYEGSSTGKYYATDGEKVVAVVQAMADAGNVPYVYGGVGENGGGYDCSGLVGYALSGEHIRIGSTNTFMGWPQTDNPQPGDVVTNSSHCGIYIGNDGNGVPQMIHAPQTGDVVRVGPVQDGMIYVKYPTEVGSIPKTEE